MQLDVRRVHLFELHIDTENNKKKKKKCNILLLEVEDVAVCFRGKKRITLQSSVSRCFESERGCMTSASCPRQTCTLDAVRVEKLNSNSTRSDQDWRFQLTCKSRPKRPCKKAVCNAIGKQETDIYLFSSSAEYMYSEFDTLPHFRLPYT